MANLKELRTRIASVKSTQQVTNAMKMVSAAKLRKAQDAINQIRPYITKMDEILSKVNTNLESDISDQYAKRSLVRKVLVIAITSNKGLCGGFNSNVVKKTTEHIAQNYDEDFKNGKVDIISIGKKGGDGFKAKGIKVFKNYNDIYDKINFISVTEIAQWVMDQYSNGSYDRVDLVYNKFKNAAVQDLCAEQFLPIKAFEIEDEENKLMSHHQLMYIFEPSMEEISQIIVPQTLKIQFYKAILDSVASEHGARMTSMHKATDNAFSLIKELRLQYNQARQAAITNEIIEIVSGATALGG